MRGDFFSRISLVPHTCVLYARYVSEILSAVELQDLHEQLCVFSRNRNEKLLEYESSINSHMFNRKNLIELLVHCELLCRHNVLLSKQVKDFSTL